MLLYNIRIAIKSLRRNPVLTALIIGGIALGICVVDDLHHRPAHVRDGSAARQERQALLRAHGQLGSRQRAYPAERRPKSLPPQITLPRRPGADASRTSRARQTRDVPSTHCFVYPDPKRRPSVHRATSAWSSATSSPMFDVPFQYGGRGTSAADAKPEQVIVIDHATNEKLFGGANSVGTRDAHRRPRLHGRRRAGAVAPVRPDVRPERQRRRRAGADLHAVQLHAADADPHRAATATAGRAASATPSRTSSAPRRDWLQFWVELPTPAEAARVPAVRRRLRHASRRSTAASSARCTTGSRRCTS